MNKFVNLGSWNDYKTLPLNLDCYPPIRLYNHNTLDQLNPYPIESSDRVMDMRKASEAHRIVRKYIQEYIKPQMKVEDICEKLENKTRELFPNNDQKSGIGFPTGFSINECVAHDSPVPNDKRIINKKDIIKVDFGTHVNGNIIDSAFTIAWNPTYEPLLKATEEATWSGIRMAGPDAVISDISEEIQEVIESHEINIKGKTYSVKAVKNLGGHDIEPYKIHGKTALILGAPHPAQKNMRMVANKCYAIETFVTAGDGAVGWAQNDMSLPTTLYSKIHDAPKTHLSLKSSKKLLNFINMKYGTLPFCTRWLTKDFGDYKFALAQLVKNKLVHAYPPLSEKKGTLSAQTEHTIFLHDYGKEILSIGPDY